MRSFALSITSQSARLREVRRAPPRTMMILALRVALCLGLLAIPAIVYTGPAAARAAADAARAGGPTPSTTHAATVSAALHVTVLFAATTPLQAWLTTVGEVSHLSGLVIPATLLAAGAAVATAAISTSPAFLAAASAAEAAAFIAACNALGSPILGSIAATVLVLFLVAAYALVPPPPIAFLALVGSAGMAAGCLAYTLATWVVAPDWATDRALESGGRAVSLAGELVSLGSGGAWQFEGGRGGGGGAGGPLALPHPPPPLPPPILPAGGELSIPRPPSCMRRRRQGRGGRDLEVALPATTAAPSASSTTPLPLPTSAADAWARVHASLAQSAQWREAARGEGCCGVVGQGRWRLMHPQLPFITSLLPARARHFPTPAAAALADATAAYARLAWTMASLVRDRPPLAGPAAAAVLSIYGREVLGKVGAAAGAAAAAVAAAVPRRYGPVDGGSAARVAAPELDALDAAVAEITALHDAGMAGMVEHIEHSMERKKDKHGSGGQGQQEAGQEAGAGQPGASASLAGLMAASAADDDAFLDEVRFAAWQSGLRPLAEAMRQVAASVEVMRAAV